MIADLALMPSIRRTFKTALWLAAAAAMNASSAPAATAGATGSALPAAEREDIPGADRMTSAERDAYRLRMEAAATPEDKARIRAEYTKVADKVTPPEPALVGDPARGAKVHSALRRRDHLRAFRTLPPRRGHAPRRGEVSRSSELSA